MYRKLFALLCGIIGLTLAVAAASAAQENTQEKAAKKITKPGTYAHFVTNHGNFTVRLLPDKAPKTVANFVGLATGTIDPATGKPGKSKPYYDGLTFHRIIAGFMIQGGDPTGTGSGGPGYRFADEIDKTHKFDKPGIMAMANAGPNTNGSQFFITVADLTSRLALNYTIFGEVVEGLDVVQAIGKVPVDPNNNNKPLKPVIMKKVTIEKVE